LSNFLNFLIRIREIKYISIRIKALRCPNTQIIQAVRPCLKEWIGRSWGRGGGVVQDDTDIHRAWILW